MPNDLRRAMSSSNAVRAKPKPIRNASMTKEVFLKQRNKVKRPKFQFDTEVLKRAEELTT